MIYDCLDEKATQDLAQTMAKLTRPGDVWALFGTLGMGKSVWARAFINSFCPENDVPSPTFTMVQTYQTPDFEIYHYDLYRLKSAEEIWELNIEEALYNGVCLIEWPEKMGAYLPRDVIRVEISPLGANGRRIIISSADKEKNRRLEQYAFEAKEENEF